MCVHASCKDRSIRLLRTESETRQLNITMEQPCRNTPAIVVPSAVSYNAPPRASNASTSTPTSMSFRYYQPPKSKRPETESEDESSEEERPRGSRRSSATSSQQAKRWVTLFLLGESPLTLCLRGACTHCKALKVKCHFVAGQSSCQRCTLNKLQCQVVGRKKRRAVA